MNKMEVLKLSVGKLTGRTGLLARKYSPEVLIGLGIVGLVSSTVMACKATIKAEEVLESSRKELGCIRLVKEQVENGDISREDGVEVYTIQDYRKDLAVVYVQTGVKFVKLYGPAITLGVASVACILGAHNIMQKRNVALVAAYKTLEQGFNSYRARVIEEYGEDKDRQYKYGVREVEVIEPAYTDEDGIKHKAKKTTVEVANPDNHSIYARWFDDASSEWSSVPEYNLVKIKCCQEYANQLLQSRGHLFLNEVYDMLGLKRSQEGAVVGWAISKDKGDNFVDFGLYDVMVDGYRNGQANDTISEERRDFVNGYRNSVLLDFNVDGVIYDLI